MYFILNIIDLLLTLCHNQRKNTCNKYNNREAMQILVLSALGAIAGNKVARYTHGDRIIHRHDAIPVGIGFIIPVAVNSAITAPPTPLRLVISLISSTAIAYFMTNTNKTNTSNLNQQFKPKPPIQLEINQTDTTTENTNSTQDLNQTQQNTQNNNNNQQGTSETMDINLNNNNRTSKPLMNPENAAQHIQSAYRRSKRNQTIKNTNSTQNHNQTQQNIQRQDSDNNQHENNSEQKTTEETSKNISQSTDDNAKKSFWGQMANSLSGLFVQKKEDPERAKPLSNKEIRLQKIRDRQKEREEIENNRRKKLEEEHGMPYAELEEKWEKERIQRQRQPIYDFIPDAIQSLDSQHQEFLNILDRNIQPLIPETTYNSLRQNISDELRQNSEVDLSDNHDYEKIFATGKPQDIKDFIESYMNLKQLQSSLHNVKKILDITPNDKKYLNEYLDKLIDIFDNNSIKTMNPSEKSNALYKLKNTVKTLRTFIKPENFKDDKTRSAIRKLDDDLSRYTYYDPEKFDKNAQFSDNADIMAFVDNLVKIKNAKDDIENHKNLIGYNLKDKFDTVKYDIKRRVEYPLRNQIDPSVPELQRTTHPYHDIQKNLDAFLEVLKPLETSSLDSLKALVPQIKKKMLNICDTHERNQLITLLERKAACLAFMKPSDDRWYRNPFDIRYHHSQYVDNTLQRPEENARLERIKAYMEEFKTITQDPTVFSISDTDAIKKMWLEKDWSPWEISDAGVKSGGYLNQEAVNKTRSDYPTYTQEEIKNTQNPLERVKKIIIQVIEESTLFNIAYHEVNGNSNKQRIDNFITVDNRRQEEYRQWAKAERERKAREQQSRTGNTSQQQAPHYGRNIDEKVKEDMFIDSVEREAFDIANRYLGKNAKTPEQMKAEILPHDTSTNEADYDKKQKQAYRQIMRLYHTDRVNHLNIPTDEKQTVTTAFTSVSQTINRLMNINYHFKKKKD